MSLEEVVLDVAALWDPLAFQCCNSWAIRPLKWSKLDLLKSRTAVLMIAAFLGCKILNSAVSRLRHARLSVNKRITLYFAVRLNAV